MSELSYFLAGFLTASILAFAGASVYYIRATRRVNSIKRAIAQYQQSKAVVGHAINKAYGSKP